MTTIYTPRGAHQAGAGTDLRERVRAALASQKQRTKTILSSLLAIQDAFHYIPREAIEETAQFCNSTSNEVWSVASFYTNFRFTPPGEFTIDVCWGPTCHLMGAQKILRAVQEKLGVMDEGETPDRKVTLRYNTCLGACGQAPCIAVNHRVTGRVSPDSAAQLAGELTGRQPPGVL